MRRAWRFARELCDGIALGYIGTREAFEACDCWRARVKMFLDEGRKLRERGEVKPTHLRPV